MSRTSRKSKPTFEIPDEAALPPAGGWVYRAEQAAEPVASAPVRPGPLLTLPMGVLAVGMGMMGRMFFGMARMMTAPVRLFLSK